MGIYLNPGNEAFAESLCSEIYVDKTGLIAYTNRVLGTEQKHICVSRPRRFGKSMAAKMLVAYYSRNCDSGEMFQGLEISQHPSFGLHRNKYDVMFLNMQSFLSQSGSVRQLIPGLQKAIIRELAAAYGEHVDASEKNLIFVLDQLYAETKNGFVIILDEWDCIFREKVQDTTGQTNYLDFLRALLKDKPYVKLAYMTGILPIKKYGTHSALNMFNEFSMTSPKTFAKYVGFTEDEVAGLCRRFHMDFAETKRWYDGYHFRKETHVYNPKSVVDAMLNEEFDNYWTQTETYEALKVYMEMNFDGLKDAVVQMLGGNRCRINPRTFQNDMSTFKNRDDVLTLLIHLGYLGYDIDTNEVFIPNMEVQTEFENAIEGAGWNEVTDIIMESEHLLQQTWRGNAEAVARALDTSHMEMTSILTYNNENALSCVISLAYYSARNYYNIFRELPAGKGFADVVFIPRKEYPNNPAMLLELKWNQSAETAIAQIEERQYTEIFKGYTGSILLVGVNYDKKTKKHQCVIKQLEFSSSDR